MYGHGDWRSMVALTCTAAVIIGAIVWNLRKSSSSPKKKKQCKSKGTNEKTDEIKTVNCQNNVNNVEADRSFDSDTIPELPNPNWVKVGQVQELYIYPMKSGRAKDIKQCFFTEFGVSLPSEDRLTLYDRMFLVYNEETGSFKTGRVYPTMILISVSAVDESKVKLEAVGMPSVVFTVPKASEKGTEAIECKLWWGEPVRCIDCGPEPAEWISRFLTGTNSGLRLACTMMDRRNVFAKPWKKFTEVYKTFQNGDMGLFTDALSYMIMTTKSMEKLNEKLERPVPALQFRPNVLVSNKEPFEEDKWEWLKIGERAVIRNIKPCNRCNLVRVDPETATVHKEEPTKTLNSFREQTDPERVAVDGKSPLMGIYCGLYVTGQVNLGDDVFVHVPNVNSELNHHETNDNQSV